MVGIETIPEEFAVARAARRLPDGKVASSYADGTNQVEGVGRVEFGGDRD